MVKEAYKRFPGGWEITLAASEVPGPEEDYDVIFSWSAETDQAEICYVTSGKDPIDDRKLIWSGPIEELVKVATAIFELHEIMENRV